MLLFYTHIYINRSGLVCRFEIRFVSVYASPTIYKDRLLSGAARYIFNGGTEKKIVFGDLKTIKL